MFVPNWEKETFLEGLSLSVNLKPSCLSQKQISIFSYSNKQYVTDKLFSKKKVRVLKNSCIALLLLLLVYI